MPHGMENEHRNEVDKPACGFAGLSLFSKIPIPSVERCNPYPAYTQILEPVFVSLGG